LPGSINSVTSYTVAPGTAIWQDFTQGRHNGGVNVAFCDGHVKWMHADDMVQEAKKPNPNLNGAWNPRLS
jgi:prepilin-type processing-associated H-X9-DG protein